MRFWGVLVVAVLTVELAACSSSGDDDGEASNETEDEEEGEPVTVAELPPAGGRDVAVISEDAAIVGGGQTSDNEDVLDREYTVVSMPTTEFEVAPDLWLLGEDGLATPLPQLPTDKMVDDLTGTLVGDTIVLAGRAGNGFDGQEDQELLLWSMDQGDSDWSQRPLAIAAITDSLENYPQSVVNVLGTRDGLAVLAISRGDLENSTRFLTFDPTSGSFDILNDGVRTIEAEYCLDRNDLIIQLAHPEGAPPVIGLSVVYMRGDGGDWSEEVPIEVDARGPALTATMYCPADGDPLIQVVMDDTAAPATQLFRLSVEDGGLAGRSVTVEPVQEYEDSLDELSLGQAPRLAGTMPTGEAVFSVELPPETGTSSLWTSFVTFTPEEGFVPFDSIGTEPFEWLPSNHSFFTYASYVGVVSDRQWGEVQLFETG